MDTALWLATGKPSFSFRSVIDFLCAVRQVTSPLRAFVSSRIKWGNWVRSLLLLLVFILLWFSRYDSLLLCQAHVDQGGREFCSFLEWLGMFLKQDWCCPVSGCMWPTLGPQIFWSNVLLAVWILSRECEKLELGREKICLWKEVLKLMWLKAGWCDSLIKTDSCLTPHLHWSNC